MFIRLKEETGHSADDIALAYTAAMAVFDLEKTFGELDQLDNKISGALQLDLYLRLRALLRQQTAWFLRNTAYRDGLSAITEQYGNGVESVRKALGKFMSEDQRARCEEAKRALEEEGVPKAVAEPVTLLRILADAPEMVLIAEQTRSEILDVAKIHGQAADYFYLPALKDHAEKLLVTDYFDRLAINSTISALSTAQRNIVQDAVRHATSFDHWLETNQDRVERTRRALDEILEGDFTLSKFMVAVGHLGDLTS